MPPLSVAAPSALRVPIEAPSNAPQRGQALKSVIQGGTSASSIFTMTGLATIPAGHLVVIVNTWASTSDLVSAGSIVDTSGNTWHSVVGSGQNPGVAILWSVTTNALTPSDTVTLTYSSGTPAARMYMWIDYGTGWGALDTSSTGSAASGGESATVTPAQIGDLAIMAVGFNGQADGNAQLAFNSPLVAYNQIHHTGTTSAYFGVADTVLPGTDAFTAHASGDQNQSSWALATFLATTAANQTVAPPVATANASQPIPGIDLAVPAPVATANAAFPTPTVAADSKVAPPVATANASQPVPGVDVGIVPPVATANASFPVPTVSVGQTVLPPVATANASQPVPGVALKVVPPVASATASQPIPGVGVKVTPPSAATASASMPVPSIGVAVLPPVATASASAPVPTVAGGTVNQNVNAPVASASASMPVPTVSPAPDSGPRIITKRDLYDHDPNFIPFRRF